MHDFNEEKVYLFEEYFYELWIHDYFGPGKYREKITSVLTQLGILEEDLINIRTQVCKCAAAYCSYFEVPTSDNSSVEKFMVGMANALAWDKTPQPSGIFWKKVNDIFTEEHKREFLRHTWNLEDILSTIEVASDLIPMDIAESLFTKSRQNIQDAINVLNVSSQNGKLSKEQAQQLETYNQVVATCQLQIERLLLQYEGVQ